MGIAARENRISYPFLAEESAENGHRSVMILPARRDLGPDGQPQHDLDLRLHEAVTKAGGSAALVDWRFPISLPGFEHNRDALIQEWNRRLEGRLADILPERLAALIRIWRPSIVLLDGSTDAGTRLLNAAMNRAIDLAADPNALRNHVALVPMEPWQTKRVFQRAADQSQGSIVINPNRWLPRKLSLARQITAQAERLMTDKRYSQAAESWNLLRPADEVSGKGFFSGILIQPGSEARRPMLPLRNEDQDAEIQLAKRQRNVLSFAERSFGDHTQGRRIVGELQQMTKGLSPNRAAQLLDDLATTGADYEDWMTVRDIREDLVKRFPEQPVAAAAMADLFIRAASEEICWQTARTSQRAGHDPIRAKGVRQASATNRDIQQPGQIVVGTQKTAREQFMDDRRADAANQVSQIREFWPELLTDTNVRFSIASLLRRRGVQGAARGYLGRLVQSSTLWQKTAQSELWIANPVNNPVKELATVRPALQRPNLDALLSDPCWEKALEIVLSDAGDNDEAQPGDRPIILMSRDSRFLYVAGSLPRIKGHAPVPSQSATRTYDADLSAYDRVILRFDTDRDYTTFYTLTIDERGWTNDKCHDIESWNPKWFVATDGDDRRWRFEIAIPFEELVPQLPASNSVWAMGVSRVVPARMIQSWTKPVSSIAQPETFGLLKFE